MNTWHPNNLMGETLRWSSGELKKRILHYVESILGSIVPGSAFEKSLGPVKHLFKNPNIGKHFAGPLCSIMQMVGKDIMIITDPKDQIVGHILFHEKSRKWPKLPWAKKNESHIFAVEIKDECEGNGYATRWVEMVINLARERGLQRVRIWWGNSDATNRIHQKMGEIEFL